MPQTNFQLPLQPQSSSTFLSRLPGEVRNIIYAYAFSEYALPGQVYDFNTCYNRPGHRAHLRLDTSLLRTCQKVYNESWFLPWTNRSHTFYLTSDDRRPSLHTTTEQMEEMLGMIHAAHGEDATTIDHVRVFPQLYNLEPGMKLQSILDLEHFNPHVFTITIRHTDWWLWESDQPLSIGAQFVRECIFPSSVREVRMELESVERRRPQIEQIARLMHESWFFKRQDGSCLFPTSEASDYVWKWEGSSSWDRRRWIRDETKPGRLEYHVQVVRFSALSRHDPQAEPGVAVELPKDLSVHGFHAWRHGRGGGRASIPSNEDD